MTSIGGSFIFGGTSLVNLSGMNNLISIGGNLRTYFSDYTGSPHGNPVLTSLNGLDNLTSIGGDLIINYNNALNSLSGLDNIDAGSISDLYISNNILLSTCEVQSICGYLASPNGTIEIHDNAFGCNSQQEVEATCGVGVDENAISESHINVFPNPATNQITIELSESGSKMNGTVSIYGMIGQELIHQQLIGSKVEINISFLPAGIYFVRLMNVEKIAPIVVGIGKFIKQ